MRPAVLFLFLLGLAHLPAVRADDPSHGELTTIFSTVHNGYHHVIRPDGTPEPVAYTFGEGIYDSGSIVDHSLEHLQFKDLIKLLTPPLARLGYQPSLDSQKVDQLIVVHWGRTTGWDHAKYIGNYGALKDAFTLPSASTTQVGGSPGGNSGNPATSSPSNSTTNFLSGSTAQVTQAMVMINLQNEARDAADDENARLLGYYHDMHRLKDTQGALRDLRHDLVEEIEDDRYYVILIAYDFPTMLKTKQRKVLWITRFSLRARGNQFDESINEMIRAASRYFGRSSDGLRHSELLQGHVNPGELKVLDYDEPKSK